jgi:hypothetical protein
MVKPKKDILAVTFLIVLVTVFFAKEIFTDQSLVTFRLTNVFPWLTEAAPEDLQQPSVTSDCTFSYYPRRVFATSMLRQGEIPFWNPHQFCGTPFLANFQSAVFYPVNLALYGLQPATQMDLFLYIHFLVAAIFTYLFARKLSISVPASALSALGFTFCGFMVTRYGQPTFISTASWLPAVLYCGELLIESPGLRRAGLLGLVVSLCILAGFPQIVLLVLYSLVAYVVMRMLLSRRVRRRSKYPVLLYLVLAVGIACTVCAFQLLPTYELSTFSYRKMLPYDMVLSSAHHPLVGLKYLVPDILGDPVELGVISKALRGTGQEPVFAQNYVSTTGYVGLLPLVLAAFALSMPSRRLIPFIALSGLALLTVFGTGLLAVFYHVLPGFNFSRIDRVILLYMFSVATMAGYGFDAALSGRGRKRLVGFGVGFMVFAVCFTVWMRNVGLDRVLAEVGDVVSKDTYMAYAGSKINTFVVISLLSGALLALRGLVKFRPRWFLIGAFAILIVDLIPNGLKFKVSQPAGGIVPPSSFVDMLRQDETRWRIAKYGADVLPSNTATILGIDDIHGYDALNVNHYVEVLGAIDSSMIAASNAALRRRIGAIGVREGLQSRVLDLLNAKHLVAVAEMGDKRQPISWLNADCLPRAFLVSRARYFDTYGGILAYMKTADFDPAWEVLLVGDSRAIEEAPVSDDPGDVEIIDYGANEVTLRARAATGCYLVLSDTYYPGWRVYLNGEEADLLRADYAFRAVRLAPGVNTVRMEYTPLYFRAGLLLSLAGVALLAVLISHSRHPRSD